MTKSTSVLALRIPRLGYRIGDSTKFSFHGLSIIINSQSVRINLKSLNSTLAFLPFWPFFHSSFSHVCKIANDGHRGDISLPNFGHNDFWLHVIQPIF